MIGYCLLRSAWTALQLAAVFRSARLVSNLGFYRLTSDFLPGLGLLVLGLGLCARLAVCTNRASTRVQTVCKAGLIT